MRPPRLSIVGMMTTIAVIAVDLALIPAIGRVAMPAVRIAYLGVLPMANLLAVCAAAASSRLARQEEVSLSQITFVLFGGMGIIVVLFVADLAPYLFFAYINNTAGLYTRGQSATPVVYAFGVGGGNPIVAMLLSFAAISLPLLGPALAAARITRGRRLRLVEASGGGSVG